MEIQTGQTTDGGAGTSLQSTDSQSIQAYKTWNSRAVSDPRESPISEVVNRLLDIIDIEGPVVLERAFHLYAGAAEIRRVGNQLRGLFLSAAEYALSSGRIEEERGQRKLSLDSVVLCAGSPPVVLRKRGPRSFEEIPMTEVAEAMRLILNTHPSLDFEDLCRRVLDFYDLRRLTSNVRRSLAKIASDEGMGLSISDSLTHESSPRRADIQTESKYKFELLGEHFEANSLADILIIVLHTFNELDKDYLSRLSQKGGRVRPIIARTPEELYPGRPDLSGYSRELVDGWFVGTNYSKKDVARILRLSCEAAELVFGEDLKGPAIAEM